MAKTKAKLELTCFHCARCIEYGGESDEMCFEAACSEGWTEGDDEEKICPGCSNPIKLHFECPKCGNGSIQEVMIDVTLESAITSVFSNGNIEYGAKSEEGGHIENYICMDCGYVIAFAGEPVTDCIELASWLKENCQINKDAN